jgi:tRNA(Arg) A34 adenosine deaminase TadA
MASSEQFCWIQTEQVLVLGRGAPADAIGWSALFALMSGIHQLFGDGALRVLRHRISTTAHPHPLLNSIVRVAAKRIQFGTALPTHCPQVWEFGQDQLIDPASIRRPDSINASISDLQAFDLLRNLRATIPLLPERFLSARPVAAIAVAGDSTLLAAAVNTNAFQKFRHAEINLLLQLVQSAGQRLPKGTRIYTSLSPCRMCAEAIAAMCEDGDQTMVHALEQDEGRLGMQTRLHRLEVQHAGD